MKSYAVDQVVLSILNLNLILSDKNIPVKRLIEPAIDQFVSYKNLFTNFHKCTIYFSSKPNALLELHTSWLNNCITE